MSSSILVKCVSASGKKIAIGFDIQKSTFGSTQDVLGLQEET